MFGLLWFLVQFIMVCHYNFCNTYILELQQNHIVTDFAKTHFDFEHALVGFLLQGK